MTPVFPFGPVLADLFSDHCRWESRKGIVSRPGRGPQNVGEPGLGVPLRRVVGAPCGERLFSARLLEGVT